MNPFPQAPTQSAEEEQLMQMLQSNPELMRKYQEELAKMQAQSKSSHPPMTSEKYLQLLPSIEKYLDTEGGLVIQPKAAFVIKFLQKRNNEKIFVNIVTHPVIDHPEEKLLVDFENQPGLRIPMSMGKLREDSDKSGAVCKVVDVVLNPKIVETAEQNVDILSFTAQIIGNYLLEKYKIAVVEDVLKKVKGLKYKGNKVEIQRVKGKKAPKIQQLSEEQQQQQEMQQRKEQELLQEINEQTLHKPVMRPQFEVLAYLKSEQKYEQYSLEIPAYSHMQILLSLPHLIHSKGIHLEGCGNMIYLSVKGIYEICLRIPYEVGKWTAVFSRKQRKLKVLAYRKEETEVKQQVAANQQIDKPQAHENGSKEDGNSKNTVITLDNDILYDLV